jgi:hypothetical protein
VGLNFEQSFQQFDIQKHPRNSLESSTVQTVLVLVARPRGYTIGAGNIPANSVKNSITIGCMMGTKGYGFPPWYYIPLLPHILSILKLITTLGHFHISFSS